MTKIAVVNDDTVFLDMMAAVLSDAGWDTVICRESSRAFEELKREQPDLIILDIRMESPESGWTLLELLTLDRQMATTPIIVCSAAIYDLRAHQEWLSEHGIAVLPKPFDIEHLLANVEQALGSPRTPS